MKKNILWISLVVFLVPGLVSAQGDTYFGVKAGSMSVDVDGISDVINAGVLVGYNVNKNLAIEGEFTTSLSDGDATISGSQGKWNIDTIAVYAVHRSAGDTYFKGKVGFLNEDISITIPGYVPFSGSDSGLSFGVGVGFEVGKSSRIEFEYTLIEADVNMLSATYLF